MGNPFKTVKHPILVTAAGSLCLTLFACNVHAQVMADVAQPSQRPALAPRYSDVSMRLFAVRKKVTAAAILQAGQDFHITRGDWSYIRDPDFIDQVHQRGWTFQGTLNSVTRDKEYALKDEQGNPIRDQFNRPNRYLGDPNNPAYRRDFLKKLKKWTDLGVDSIQQDGPTGIGKWSIEDSAAFYQSIFSQLEADLDRPMTWSLNLGWNRSVLGGKGEPVTRLFDFGMAEMPRHKIRPNFFWDASKDARQRQKALIYTTYHAFRVGEYRRAIAGSYASGMHFIVPWDQHAGAHKPRVFSKPRDLADLYGFVRANAAYLDGYEDAAVAGHGLRDPRWDISPVRIRGDQNVSAWVRAIPNRPQQPIVIHLTDWDNPQPFTVRLRTANYFNGAPLKVTLMRPPRYNRQDHVAAQKHGNYQALSQSVPLPVVTQGQWSQVRVPEVAPWGMLLVEKAQ